MTFNEFAIRLDWTGYFVRLSVCIFIRCESNLTLSKHLLCPFNVFVYNPIGP